MWFKRKAASAAEVVVLIEAGGSSFSAARGQPWIGRIRADRWRDADGCLSNEPLDAEMTLDGVSNGLPDGPSDEVVASWSQEWYRAASGLSVVRLSGSWADESRASRKLILDQLPEPVEDQELAAIADALNRPVVIHHEVFGDFVLNRNVRWFTATPNWRGRPIDVTVAATQNDEIHPESLAATESFWNGFDRWHDRCVDCAVENLLDLKNDGWLDHDEAPITAADFAGRIHPSSVSVDDDDAVVFFNDGDLFFGHTIIVSGPLASGPQDAQIAG